MPTDNDMDLLIVFDERIVERRQGCWNCTHFLLGEKVERVWEGHQQAHLLKIRQSGIYARENIVPRPDAKARIATLTRQGIPQQVAIEMVISEAAANDPRIEMLQKVSTDIQAQRLGICDIGANGAAFVYRKFLCDKWNGRDGASMAIGTDGMDELPGELKERLDGKGE